MQTMKETSVAVKMTQRERKKKALHTHRKSDRVRNVKTTCVQRLFLAVSDSCRFIG